MTVSALLTGLLALGGFGHASQVSTMSQNSQEMFNQSMAWLDKFYDPAVGYLIDVSAVQAMDHNTRSSGWYAVGLLARAEGDDVQEAEKVINAIIEGQFTDPEQQWFGDYQKYPEEPIVDSTAYPPEIYGSWDPNWRGFVGSTFIIILEEYNDLLSAETIKAMEDSLHLTAVGDTYRVGGVDGDNLYPSYSNPSLMRALTSVWVGQRLDDSNLTEAGEHDAHELIKLFSRANTLSEFNSGTYTGVSLYALALWAKYIPEEHFMNDAAREMVAETWKVVAEFWHPDLKNTAGPWDRAYGFDSTRYVSLLSLWIWDLVGHEASGLHKYPEVMSHSNDYAYAPVFAALADFHRTLVPDEVLPKLVDFSGEHTFVSTAYSPPWDNAPRNITAWLGPSISIGAESFDQEVVGGAAKSQKQFNPAVVQWDARDGRIGFISLYSTETALEADVSPYRLGLSYPSGNASSVFTLLVSTFRSKTTISGWEDLVGISANVTTNLNANYSLSFAGANGGEHDPINDFEFWNFTYVADEDFEGVPEVVLEFEY